MWKLRNLMGLHQLVRVSTDTAFCVLICKKKIRLAKTTSIRQDKWCHVPSNVVMVPNCHNNLVLNEGFCNKDLLFHNVTQAVLI